MNNRRRMLTSVVTITSAGVLAAVTIPAVAGTSRVPRPSEVETQVETVKIQVDPPPVATELAPELLAALQRDLGLTAEQTRTRHTRESWATQTVSALRADLTGQWAGAWLTDGADQLMVAVTDEAAAARVRAAGAEPRIVARSESQLDALKTTLDRRAELAADAVSGWYTDVATNTVVLVAPSWAESAARDFASSSGLPAEAVRVVASDESPRLLFDVQGGDSYFIDVVARCSIGFSVEGGFVTAGHCALAGTTTTGSNGEAQGQFRAVSFPGVGAGGPDDWAVVAVNGDWTPQPVVTDFAGNLFPVAGSDEAPVGASVCKHGSTTGVTCGVIQAKNATVNYPEGTVTGLTQTDVCAEPGDSGGSWLSGDQAQGVTSGGSGDCTTGGTTFFQPVNEILEANDLVLVTTGGAGSGDMPRAPEEPPTQAAPPADEDATRACAQDNAVRLAGRLSRQQSTRTHSYRATSAGTHAICLNGPDSADFDLVLQQWDGTAFRTVASVTGPTTDEVLTFDSDAPGLFRLGVVRNSGSGRYQIALNMM